MRPLFNRCKGIRLDGALPPKGSQSPLVHSLCTLSNSSDSETDSLWARLCPKLFMHPIPCILTSTEVGTIIFIVQVRRQELRCSPRSHSWQVVALGFQPACLVPGPALWTTSSLCGPQIILFIFKQGDGTGGQDSGNHRAHRVLPSQAPHWQGVCYSRVYPVRNGLETECPASQLSPVLGMPARTAHWLCSGMRSLG